MNEGDILVAEKLQKQLILICTYIYSSRNSLFYLSIFEQTSIESGRRCFGHIRLRIQSRNRLTLNIK